MYEVQRSVRREVLVWHWAQARTLVPNGVGQVNNVDSRSDTDANTAPVRGNWSGCMSDNTSLRPSRTGSTASAVGDVFRKPWTTYRASMLSIGQVSNQSTPRSTRRFQRTVKTASYAQLQLELSQRKPVRHSCTGAEGKAAGRKTLLCGASAFNQLSLGRTRFLVTLCSVLDTR